MEGRGDGEVEEVISWGEWGEEDSCVTAQSWGGWGYPRGDAERRGSAAEEDLWRGSNAGAPAAPARPEDGTVIMAGMAWVYFCFSTRVRVGLPTSSLFLISFIYYK